MEELRLASAGFEPFVESGQGVVIDGAGPAAVEGFLRWDVGGDRHGSGGFEFCEGERGDAAAALLCGGGAVLINAPALQRGEQEGAEEAVSRSIRRKKSRLSMCAKNPWTSSAAEWWSAPRRRRKA